MGYNWIDRLIYLCMPLVYAYHLICANPFLNVAAQDASGFEKLGNFFLSPVQYLLVGKTAIPTKSEYRLEQTFDYNNALWVKSISSIVSLPVSLPIGCALKGIGYLSSSTVSNHRKIVAALHSREVVPKLDLYRALGIEVDRITEYSRIVPLFERHPGEEKKLFLEKELLAQVAKIFKECCIPFWIDCGTCLGAYRYGGSIPWDNDIDIAILAPDFDNALNALHGLDPKKYQVQDWSHRTRPKSYLRVYILENRNHIDIYHFEIQPEKKTVSSILSYENSVFMSETWKKREREYTHPTKYETIFPLKKGVFDGIEVYLPKDTKKYLQERYGENLNPVKVYNETTGEYEKNLTHPYWISHNR